VKYLIFLKDILHHPKDEYTRQHISLAFVSYNLAVRIRALHLVAKVELNEWAPEHETLARKLVQPEGVLAELALDVFLPLHHRALIAAGLLKE